MKSAPDLAHTSEARELLLRLAETLTEGQQATPNTSLPAVYWGQNAPSKARTDEANSMKAVVIGAAGHIGMRLCISSIVVTK